MLNPPLLILHLTSSSVLGCNARTAVINSPENCSITCHCNDWNASICVSFLSGCDDAYWLEKRGTCSKAPLKLSSQCVREAAGNLVIISKSIFTFSLTLFHRRVRLSPAQKTWQRSFPAFGSRKGGKRDPVLLLYWETSAPQCLRDLNPVYLFTEMENIDMCLHGNYVEMWVHVITHKHCADCGFCYFPGRSCSCNGVYAGVSSLNKISPCLSLSSELLYSLVSSAVISKI